MKVAIVGCGISGANVLKNIIEDKKFSKDIYIDVFENRSELAVGRAYEDDSLCKVLNTPIRHMNINLDNKNEFKNWLEKNYDSLPTYEGKIPRPIFGEYAKDSYKKYINHENVSIYHTEVKNIFKNKNIFNLETNNKSYGPYQAVFLTIGQSYYKDDYNLNAYKNYIANPYPLREKISDIKDNDRIGIIGTGPTAIDIYRYLRENSDFKNPLYFFTNSTFFALPEITNHNPKNICSIDDTWVDDHKDEQGFVKLSDFKKAFNDDFRKASLDFDEIYNYYKDNSPELSKKSLKDKDFKLEFCQSYTLELWYVSSKLYNSFYGKDQIKFREEYLPKIVYLMTKTPAITIEKILADLEAGKIKVIEDTDKINYIEGKFKVTTENDQEFIIDKIYNAQGFEKDLTKAIENDDLLKNLFNNRLIEADVNKNINVSYPSYNPLTSKYGQIKNLYLNGMWTESVDISNNDLRSVLISSEQMAKDFMKNLKS